MESSAVALGIFPSPLHQGRINRGKDDLGEQIPELHQPNRGGVDSQSAHGGHGAQHDLVDLQEGEHQNPREDQGPAVLEEGRGAGEGELRKERRAVKKPVDEPEPEGPRQSLQERHPGKEDQGSTPVGQEALHCSPQEEDGHPHPGGVPGLDPGLEPVVQNIPGLKEVGSPQEKDDRQGLPPLAPLQEESRKEEGQGGQASQNPQEESLGQGFSALFRVQDKVTDDDPL